MRSSRNTSCVTADLVLFKGVVAVKQRIITGVLAGAGFLALLYWGGYAFHLLLLIMAFIGFDELVRMSQSARTDFPAIAGYAGVGLFVFPWKNGEYVFAGQSETWIWLVMLLLMSGMVFGKNKTPIHQTATLFFGVVYIGLGFHYMAVTRWLEDGIFWTLFLFVCIWITDAGAYFTGFAFGKHKLWPTISPKKTIEGALGGLALSIGAAILFSLIQPELITIGEAALLGLSIGVVGQIGDLIQSAYKRTYGVKDSGTILPGHGGILDRCDSWLIVFPFVHLVTSIIT